MIILKLIDTVAGFFADILKKPGEVIAVFPQPDEGWKVQIEVTEDSEYMRKRARDDLMAIYEVSVDKDLQILGFERLSIRERNASSI
ncbi:MAG: Gas vesicle synthesis protein GvpO [Pelotomaculum sp. PtaU1.Bin035]|nr:MAG: Gas vesicle synthesis protein GvpO [Pelotomaculum sp. PtaU1.Bin035]